MAMMRLDAKQVLARHDKALTKKEDFKFLGTILLHACLS